MATSRVIKTIPLHLMTQTQVVQVPEGDILTVDDNPDSINLVVLAYEASTLTYRIQVTMLKEFEVLAQDVGRYTGMIRVDDQIYYVFVRIAP
jgi:hypothetical protein